MLIKLPACDFYNLFTYEFLRFYSPSQPSEFADFSYIFYLLINRYLLSFVFSFLLNLKRLFFTAYVHGMNLKVDLGVDLKYRRAGFVSKKY